MKSSAIVFGGMAALALGGLAVLVLGGNRRGVKAGGSSGTYPPPPQIPDLGFTITPDCKVTVTNESRALARAYQLGKDSPTIAWAMDESFPGCPGSSGEVWGLLTWPDPTKADLTRFLYRSLFEIARGSVVAMKTSKSEANDWLKNSLLRMQQGSIDIAGLPSAI